MDDVNFFSYLKQPNMFQLRSSLLIFALMATTANYSQFTDVINSNRPGESMSAFSVGKTVIQAELGVYGLREKNDLSNTEAKGFGTDLSVRYGAFFEQLEIILDLQYQSDKFVTPTTSYKRNAFKQTTIGGKYLLYDPMKNYESKPNLYSWKANHKFSWRAFIPAIAVYAGANINLSDNEFSFPTDPKISPKLMVMTQNQFGKNVLVINVISDKLGSDYPSLGYIITMTHGFNSQWSGFIENQGMKSDYYKDILFRGGAAYLLKENIQVDASIGANIKDTPAILIGGIGLSWRFDKNYKDVILRAPKEEKSKDKNDKKKKEKKRKDGMEDTELTQP